MRLYVCACLLLVFPCATRLQVTKRALDPCNWSYKLPDVGAGNTAWVLSKRRKLLATKPSLQTLNFFFFKFKNTKGVGT